MAMMTLILADSGFGKTYSLRNVNPENAILARCIRKANSLRKATSRLCFELSSAMAVICSC